MCTRTVDDLNSYESVRELLGDGWEPFSVVGLIGTAREIWFRRLVVIDDRSNI